MKKLIFIAFAVSILNLSAIAQVPIATGIQILKAEDARRYDTVLESLMKSPNSAIRARAALAAGRIGDERAIPALAALFEDRKNTGAVWTMAVFALGEIESVKGADSVITVIKSESAYIGRDHNLLSRAFEAAGKIAAANAKDPMAKELGEVIVEGLKLEGNAIKRYPDVFQNALTAILRARPADGEKAVIPFLASDDPNVVATALNTLARLRAKNANTEIRKLLTTSTNAVVRANAARVLGAAEDKDAFGLLLNAATADPDSRVRVSAIRSLAALKDPKAADKLIERGNYLLTPIHGDPGPIKLGQKIGDLKPIEVPLPKNELLEIATTVGRLLAGTTNTDALKFLKRLSTTDKYSSTETESAIARVAADQYEAWTKEKSTQWKNSAKAVSSAADALAVIGGLEVTDANKALKAETSDELRKFLKEGSANGLLPLTAVPDVLGAFATFKTADLTDVARQHLRHKDVIVRAAASGIIADQPMTKESVSALNDAFTSATATDKYENDAQLAILDALFKLDKKAGIGSYSIALASPDYLVRKKAFEILADKDMQAAYPEMAATVASERMRQKDQVLAYKSVFGTKLGQVLNTDADYRRALSRKNGSIKAVLTTEKGTFTIVFNPEEAPLTVDNWVKLARSGYFNGLEVHRVVPNFVMQDGDPRGDGNGGPGWSIRCEVNMLGYDRGAVGMALSGKDTGGSQWFVTHSPQPHLDGGYTVFGHVSEADMKVVDNIARGDKILKVTIIGK